MLLANGFGKEDNCIQAGSIVYIRQMGTNGMVCFNVLYPGFVQVSSDIPLGLLLWSSTFMVQQFDMLLSLHQECASGNWRFMVEDKHVRSGQRKNSLIYNKGQLLFRAEGRFAAH